MADLETYDKPVEFPVVIATGKEWHSKPITLHEGDIVTVTALGNDKFYAGFFDRVTYVRRRGTALGSFAFDFGTDKLSWTTRKTLEEDDDYYLVFRAGVFTSGFTTISVRWLLTHPR